MRWMTLKEIKSAAAKGPLPALDNSIAKYTQMLNAPADELRKKMGKTKSYVEARYCSCCNATRDSDNRINCEAGCIIAAYFDESCVGTGYGVMVDEEWVFMHKGGPITPLRKAIRVLIRNMKKARKAFIQEQGK